MDTQITTEAGREAEGTKQRTYNTVYVYHAIATLLDQMYDFRSIFKQSFHLLDSSCILFIVFREIPPNSAVI